MSPPEFVNTEPCEVHLIDTSDAPNESASRDGTILTAIEAIRETTSRKQAIAALEALLTTQAATAGPLLSRAFEIADESMFDLLQVSCIDQDGRGLVLGLTNAQAIEVHSLAEADENLIEAFEWLRDRGYVVLASDEFGEHIIVERRPAE